MSEQPMTPAQAADYTELAFASTLRLGARPAHALRVLIDHARAAAAVLDNDDRAGLRRWIADQVVDLVGGDFALADVIGDSLVDNIGRTIERALDTSPAPSVAAPPQEGNPRWSWPSDPWAHFTGEYLVKAAEEGRFTDADIDVIADLMAHADESRSSGAGPVRVAAPGGGDLAELANELDEVGRRRAHLTWEHAEAIRDQLRAHRCAPAPSVAAPPREDDRLAALAATWDENAAGERRILRSPNVTVDEAHSCEPVARAWSEAASDLRAALAAPGTVRDPERAT
jgi:hypothetical protein